MSDSVPSHWATVSLSEIAEVRLGRQRSPKNVEGRHQRPYLRAANVTWDGLALNDVKEMNFEPHEASTYELREGDILLSEASGSASEVGKPAVWRNEIPGACFQNTLIRVRPFAAASAYLYWHFLWNARAGHFAAAGKGVGINHLGADKMNSWPTRLPPAGEQLRIAEKLAELVGGSRRAKSSLDAVRPLLGKLRQAILAAACRGDLTADWRAKNPVVEPADQLLARIRTERRAGLEAAELAKPNAKGVEPERDSWNANHLGPRASASSNMASLPSGWCWTTIGMVGDILNGRQRAKPQTGEARRPYLRIANIGDDEVAFDDVNDMAADPDSDAKYRLLPYDILVSAGQSLEKIGQSAMFLPGMPDVGFQKNIFRFRPSRAALVPEYAQLVFRTWVRTGVFLQRSSITTNLAYLTTTRFAECHFPLPPHREQVALVQLAKQLLDTVKHVALLHV